jgi:hypothetical protein
MAGELCCDLRIDLRPVRDPPVVVAVTRVIGEGGITENFGAETPPFPLVLDGDQDFLAVAGRKQAVRGDRWVGETHPLRRAAAIIEMDQRHRHPFCGRVEQRYAEQRPVPGPLPSNQRFEDCGVGVEPGRDVGHRRADPARRFRRSGQ